MDDDPDRFVGPWWDAHTFISDRFVLRPPRSIDAEGFVASIDDVVRTWQGWDDAATWTVKQARRTFAEFDAKGPSLGRSGCPSVLLVCSPAEDEVLGCYRFSTDRRRRLTTLGWHLGPHGRGRGLATPTLVAVLDYGHRHVAVDQIVMETDENNERARRQIEGAGARESDRFDRTLPDGSAVRAIGYLHDATFKEVASVWATRCPEVATGPDRPKRLWGRNR